MVICACLRVCVSACINALAWWIAAMMLAVTAVTAAAAVVEAAELVVGVNGACWVPLVFSAAPLFGFLCVSACINALAWWIAAMMLAVTAVAEAAAVIEAADFVVGVNGACWVPLVFSAAPLFGFLCVSACLRV